MTGCEPPHSPAARRAGALLALGLAGLVAGCGAEETAPVGAPPAAGPPAASAEGDRPAAGPPSESAEGDRPAAGPPSESAAGDPSPAAEVGAQLAPSETQAPVVPAEAPARAAGKTAGTAGSGPTEAVPGEPDPVPLDALLRAQSALGPPPRRAVDLQTSPEPEATAEAAQPGAIERVKQRLHLERRSEPIGPAGPRQGTRTETDAGVRVRLDEDIDLEGGVRVDQRDEPGAETPERKSTPRVGVEVRF